MPPTITHAAAPAYYSRQNSSSFQAGNLPEIRTRSVSRVRALRMSAAVGIALILLAAGPVASAEPVQAGIPKSTTRTHPFAEFITEAAQRFAIPASWIRAVMQAESFGDARALSPKGAMGLMQIMPATWSVLRARYGLGSDPYDPHDNILAGAAYLRELHDRYGQEGFLAAYNAGPARYEVHLATGRPLPPETQAYVAGLASPISDGSLDGAVPVAPRLPSWAGAPLFAPHEAVALSQAAPSSDPRPTHTSPDAHVQDWTALAPQSGSMFVRITSRTANP
jgi:soluble lytic murein transglycosylase-like protein